LREHFTLVFRSFADHCFQIAIRDRDDQGKVPRAQQLQRRKQFARTFLVN
jgi:hypothetical protein